MSATAEMQAAPAAHATGNDAHETNRQRKASLAAEVAHEDEKNADYLEASALNDSDRRLAELGYVQVWNVWLVEGLRSLSDVKSDNLR
jgi:hypothetical protein